MSERHIVDWKKVGAIVPEQLPDFVRSLSPQLTSFIKAYYDWMDQADHPNHALANLRNYRDIDRTLDEFVDFFHNEYLERIPKSIACDRRLLIKHIVSFYRAAGNKKSVRFLFRVLFNEEIDFYIPGQDILRLSDGKWQVDKSLKVSLFDPAFDVNQLTYAEIVGSNSGARTRVEKIVLTAGTVELFVSRIIGEFEPGESILLGSELVAEIDSHGLYTYQGRWLNTDGFLSSEKRFQDNFFYQEFSYVIKAGRTLDSYAEILKGLIHPAGTKMFGQIQLVQDAGLAPPSVEQSWVTLSSAQDSIVAMIPQVVSNLLSGDGLDGVDQMLSYESMVSVDDSGSTSINVISGSAIAGTPRLSTSSVIGTLGGIPISSLVGWTASTFIDGTGVLGTGSSYLSDLQIDELVLWRDLDSVVPDQYNEIKTISGDNALILKFKPYGSVTHPAIVA